MRKSLVAVFGLLVSILVVLTVINVSTAATSAPAPGPVLAVTPSRIMDTRTNFGVSGPLAPNQDVSLQVAGRGGVPLTASSVFVNVTVTEPTAGGYITVYPTGSSRPNASSLNFSPNQTIPNLVIIVLGTGGKIQLFNGSPGTVHLIADVTGYVDGGAPTTTTASTTTTTTASSTTTTPPVSSAVWVWGQRGQDDVHPTPSVIPELADVGVAEITYWYALKSDGTVLVYSGITNEWNAVAGISGVIHIARSDWDYYALKSDGTVWAWGSNGQGELGNNSTVDSEVPVQVSGLTGITAISSGGSGYGNAFALKSDGTVWAWGYNGQGNWETIPR